MKKNIDYNNELLERMDIIIDYIKSGKENLRFRVDRLRAVQKPETDNNIEVLKKYSKHYKNSNRKFRKNIMS